MKIFKFCSLLLTYSVALYLMWLIPNEISILEYDSLMSIRDVENMTFSSSENGLIKQLNSEIIHDYFEDFRLFSSTKEFRNLSTQEEYQVVITPKGGYNKVNATILVFEKDNGEVMTILKVPIKYLFLKKDLYGPLSNVIYELLKGSQ